MYYCLEWQLNVKPSTFKVFKSMAGVPLLSPHLDGTPSALPLLSHIWLSSYLLLDVQPPHPARRALPQRPCFPPAPMPHDYLTTVSPPYCCEPSSPHPGTHIPIDMQGFSFSRRHCVCQHAACQSHSTLRLPTCCEHLLTLSNPCWTLPVGCSLVHRGQVESTINLYPAKGKVMAMSVATTSLEWPD